MSSLTRSILVIMSNWWGHSFRDQVLEIILCNTLLIRRNHQRVKALSVCMSPSSLWGLTSLFTLNTRGKRREQAVPAENTPVPMSPCISMFVIHHLTPLLLLLSSPSLCCSSISFILCVEALIKSPSWFPAQPRDDEVRIFQVREAALLAMGNT